MQKYLVELVGVADDVVSDGWKEMMKAVDHYKAGVVNVYKVNGEEKEVCDWIQGRLNAYRKDGENAKVHKVKSYESKSKEKKELTRAEKAFEILKDKGEVKVKNDETGKETYEELKALCKKNDIASTGRFCKTYYKVTLK